ncbi:hypothetical protein GCM10011581_02620 [Saccharopolyspora subtropica]|uniref:Uncharacterized protein n=1 Tax=Saccharopolyspora thermophila TaxID=89367 RepID=A0A917N814_9PSEU|nr:hypothetical protein GCM10011581_02620 [Saccharopolyspora subtropica]
MGDDGGVTQHDRKRAEWERRRKLAEIFGDVLPDTTSDDRAEPGGDAERWYRENRPPHHDPR